MQIKEIYQKDIERLLNPAVSADDYDEETVKVEIDEYVFTEEIVEGLYNLLNAIRERRKSHDGIWISGYFGSGKSHFLKYMNYCFDPKYRDHALSKLIDAVENEFDTLSHPELNISATPSEFRELASWIKSATVDTVIFNISHVHNSSSKKSETFLSVFWNEFNRHRGFNASNLALAQYFEKPLALHNKLDEFKALIREECEVDWTEEADQLATTEIDYVMDAGKRILPSLSTDIIRTKVANNEIVLSVEEFTKELANYLKDKNDNYRMVFLVDEVSQFISSHKDLLLQLQSIVEKLHSDCADKIWVACTAQQDLSEFVESFQMNQASEDYGKIMGRFEVRMSLKGTSPEYITQRRVLEKNGVGERELGDLYKEKREALGAQFILPQSYKAFENEQQFVSFYPFVPYQLRLIRQVFDSFVKLGYVETEVKGNERSIIKVTFKAAQFTSKKELGFFVPFDQFFYAMFQDALLDKGLRALKNAAEMAKTYTGDVAFAQRVVNALFMVANMGENDKLLFKATIDNLTTLLMDNLDAVKAVLKKDVQDVLDFLCEKKAIHAEEDKTHDKIYMFYNEDEMEVATLIANTSVDLVKQADILHEEIFKYLGVKNKERFGTRDFSIGAELWTRNYLSTNNPDIRVAFVMESEANGPDQYATMNDNNRLAFYMADLYHNNVDFRRDFYWYCQVQRYMDANLAQTEVRDRTHKDFQNRARQLLETKLLPTIKSFLDSCKVVSGGYVVSDGNVPGKAKERYKHALEHHMGRIYSEASLVEDYPESSDALSKQILRPVDNAAFTMLKPAEKKVEDFLMRHGNNCQVQDVIRHFSKPPYGWNEICTLCALNELVRTPRYEFKYNSGRADVKTVAQFLYKAKDCFEITEAAVIPQELLNSFIETWNKVFNEISVGVQNEANALFTFAKDDQNKGLPARLRELNELKGKVANYPFASCLADMIDVLDTWNKERDVRKFFELVVQDGENAIGLHAKCRELKDFADEKLDKYKEIRRFVDVNADNFNHLEDCADQVEKLRAIKTDEWPIGTNFRSYRKLKDELEPKLTEIRDATKQEIQGKVDALYASLEELVKSLNLKNPLSHYLSDNKAAYLARATSRGSIAELKLSLHNVDDDGNRMKTALYDAANEECEPVAAQPATGEVAKPENKTPALKKRKIVLIDVKKLMVNSGKPLQSEEEVDAYLKDLTIKLKLQLMEHVNAEECAVIQ